jgi:hypothetical protein
LERDKHGGYEAVEAKENGKGSITARPVGAEPLGRPEGAKRRKQETDDEDQDATRDPSQRAAEGEPEPGHQHERGTAGDPAQPELLGGRAEGDDDEGNLQSLEQDALEGENEGDPVEPEPGLSRLGRRFSSSSPAKPLTATRRTAFANHCSPKISSSAPITSRRTSIGSAVRAVPSAPPTITSTTKPTATPMSVERHPRIEPTPTTIATISTASTTEARKVVANVPPPTS